MAGEDTGHAGSPLRTFCARLKRLQQAAGLTQGALAGHADLGKSQMSAILNGGITRLPDWDVICAVVGACLDHAAEKGKTLPADISDKNDWKRRYGDVERDIEVDALPRRRGAGPAGRPIRQWDPFALGVHHPITPARRRRARSDDLPALPPYVMREHDRRVRKLLDPAQPGRRMVLLVGGSCTGKTRAVYEAVRSCMPEWKLVRPETSADLVQLLAGHPPGPQTVLWLNETRAYLDGQHGEEAAAALRRLLAGRPSILVVGSMWLTDWQTLTRRPGPGQLGQSQARELLDQSAIKINVPSNFTGQALADMKKAAGADPRLAEAVKTASDTGEIAQLLAGGPRLIDFYEHEADPHTKAVLDAAIDARLLGHHAALPAILLKEGATGYLDERQRVAGEGWFDRALSSARAKIRETIAPLAAVRTRRGVGDPDGYLLADYLVQHASANWRILPPVELWDALAAHTASAADHDRIADSARQSAYWRHAALHLRSVGDTSALARLLERAGRVDEAVELWPPAEHGHAFPVEALAGLLERAGRLDEAAVLWRRLAERDDTFAMGALAEVLERAGRLDEAIELWQRLAAKPDDVYATGAVDALAGLLGRAGRVDEAIEVLLPAAERGDADAMQELADLLARAGRSGEAERWLRRSVERGDDDAMQELAGLLERAGRVDEAVEVLLPAAERDDDAMQELAGLLERAGRVDEAVEVLLPAAERDDDAMQELAGLLERAGRVDEAVEVLLPAAERDDDAMQELAGLLERAGRSGEAERWLRRYSEGGDSFRRGFAAVMAQEGEWAEEAAAALLEAAHRGDAAAVRALASVLGVEERGGDAERWLRCSAERGDAATLEELAGLVLGQVERLDEATALLSPFAGPHDTAVCVLAGVIARAGRVNEAIELLLPGAELGDTDAMQHLAELLERAGRGGDAEPWLRSAAQHGDIKALGQLAGLLRRSGRAAEADLVVKFGLEPGGRTAEPWARGTWSRSHTPDRRREESRHEEGAT